MGSWVVLNSFKVVKNFGKPKTISSYITAYDDIHFLHEI